MEKTGLDWQKLLLKISAYTTCSHAEDQILSTEAYSHHSLAEKNMEMVASFKKIFASNDRKRIRLESFENIDSILYSTKKGQSLTTQDLNNTRLFFEDIKAITQLYPWAEHPSIFTLIQRVVKPEIFLSKITKLINENGDFRSDASHLLYESFNKKKSLSKQIHQTLDRLVKDFSLESVLQDKYVTTREGRWVLPVISGRQHDFKGIIHDSSNSKQTVYMEPEEVVHLNNKVRELEETIRQEIERLLKEISLFLFEKHSEIHKSFEALIEIDRLSSLALWALDYQAQKVEINKSKTMLLKNVFHPFLIDEKHPPIKNDFELLKDENILLLSGPNAGGKTVLLKSVGLACQMARCGFLVCAHPESSVPFFKEIHVLIGDHQSVEESLSTFAAHLKALDHFSKLKGAENLVLIDEICGATEANEGSALARAFIEKMSKNGLKGFITSHLGPLKSGWEENSKVINASMFFDTKKGQPTYEFIKGVPGDSLAIETAKKVGVHHDILDRAMHFLTPEQRKKYSGLIEIESLQESLKTQKDLLAKKEREVEELRSEYKEMIAGFKREQDDLLEMSIKRAQERMNQNSNYSSIQKAFENRVHLEKMKASSPNFVKTSSEKVSEEVTQENFSKKFPPGTPVYIPSLKKNGVVQGTVNNQGYVPVMSDSMRILIKWSDARAIEKKSPGAKSGQKSSGAKEVLQGKIENQIDLRGMDVESALAELEDAIDKSLRLECDRLKIVHGHGTEKIKKNVRNFLSRHPLVKTWKADHSDGATQALF